MKHPKTVAQLEAMTYDEVQAFLNSHAALLEVALQVVEWADKVPVPYRDWPFVIKARAALESATS